MKYIDFLNWYENLPEDEQYEVDAIADEEGISYYDEATEEQLSYLKDMYESGYIEDMDEDLLNFTRMNEFGDDIIFDISDTLNCSEKSAEIIYEWYDEEGIFDDFETRKEFLSFLKTDIFDMIDACDDEYEANEVLKDIKIQSSINIFSNTTGPKLWMGKYIDTKGSKHKVYFEGPAAISKAEKLFKKHIPEPYVKSVFLGSAPSEKLLKADGFTYMKIESSEQIDDELETTEQEFTSKDTSINSSKLPVIYKLVRFPEGSVVLDFGGGRFDNGVDYLESIGCEGYVYDPYNRDSKHNSEVIKAIRANGGADIVLNSNVLNVIKEYTARQSVLKNIKKLVKPSGKVYITVYEGNGSGEGRQSKKDSFQLNRKTEDYLEEIQEVFPGAKRKGKLIIAK